MNKLLVAILLIIACSFHAQVITKRTCGTEELPQQYESWIQSLKPAGTPGKYGSSETQSIFNIPVIVHIIHNGEAVNGIGATTGNNLNAAQVIDQINILNKDFNGTNADTSLIPAVFKPLIGKFKINFCLAVVNPTGGILAEPGINRIDRNAKGWSGLPYGQTYINSTVKPNSIWNPSKYFNMWVLPLSSGLLGYATFPSPGASGLQGLSGTFGGATTDGVVILNTSFGSIGTAQFGQYNKGRTATHEVGHWIGLRHIWGDANCGTDYCTDTPPAQSANYNCPGFPYKSGICAGNTTGEMTMNFMDYTNDACMYMFTADQKNRAQLIMTNSTLRASLITSTVCNLPTLINDIGITYVAKPTYSQVINCVNYIDPIVSVTNFGSNVLTSALFSFNVDGVNTQTLSWAGSAAPNTSFTVALTQISGLNSGAHVFNVTVSSPNGLTDNNPTNNINQQNFSVSNAVVFTAPSGTICQGASLVLTASGATSYSWSNGVTTASVSLNPSATTIYTVTGTSGACSSPKTVTVTVQAAPVLSINTTSVCEGMPTVITASGANSYTWNSGANFATVSVTLYTPTNLILSGSSNAGCVSTQTYVIGVNPLPTSSIIASHASCGSCSDATLSVNASGGAAPYTYNWSPGNITTATATNMGIGCYTVTITDALGCKKTDETCVSFDTGIRENKSSKNLVNIIPNPTQGEFEVNFVLAGLKSIIITDALGKIIQTQKTDSMKMQINLNGYSTGVYYVKVFSSDVSQVLKVVKN